MTVVHRDEWGPWSLDVDDAVLVLTMPDLPDCPIELRECLTSARVLDFVVQVKTKTWCNDVCLAGLVRLLDDVLRLQWSLCGGGASRTISAPEIRQLSREAGTLWGRTISASDTTS